MTVYFVIQVEFQWKDVIFLLQFECNKNTSLFNNLMTFVALKTYKYNIYCRLKILMKHSIF